MCFYDLLEPEFCHEQWLTARKSHRCDECRRVIEVRESYRKTIGKWDGEFQTWKHCQGCLDLIETIAAVEKSHGCSWEGQRPGLGVLYESLRDCPEARDKLLPLVIEN